MTAQEFQSTNIGPCSSSPNCVSSEDERDSHKMERIPFKGAAESAMEKIVETLKSFDNAKVVHRRDNYVRAEFKSAIFKFVDDVELLVNPDKNEIKFRSASRTGYYDFGVNRRRMEEFKERFLRRAQQ